MSDEVRVQLLWNEPPLDMWAIVGMNHYFVEGKKYLFVAMMRDGRCIKAEGVDEHKVFQELAEAARTHN